MSEGVVSRFVHGHTQGVSNFMTSKTGKSMHVNCAMHIDVEAESAVQACEQCLFWLTSDDCIASG